MLLLLIGCANFGFDWFSDDTATDTGDGVDLLPNPTADIDWDAERFRLTITQGDNYSFRFGIAETSAECGINTDVGCWTGEDCGSGYESPQGTFIHSATCHPAVANGTLELEYSTSLEDVIIGNNEQYVAAGQKTAFPAPTAEQSYEFSVTYFLESQNMTSQEVQCWVWGSDPDYFATRGCRTPIPLRPTTSNENAPSVDMDDSPGRTHSLLLE